MSTAKSEVSTLLESLPEDASLEDIQYHLYVLEKVKKGVDRAETEMASRHLVWSPGAVEDLESIAAYIERDSAHYARAVVTKIVATAKSIPDNPKMGRELPEMRDPNIRERFVTSIDSSTNSIQSGF